MKRLCLLVLLGGAACANPAATTETATTSPAEATVAAPTDSVAATEAQARELAARYFRAQPDSAVYELGTMTSVDAGASWQVLVKRSDRVGIKPDNAAVNVNKRTGEVSRQLVK